MNSLSFDKKEIAQMRSGMDSNAQLSERTFNVLFSGILLWGFVLNFLMVHFLQTPVYRFMLQHAESLNGIMIGFLLGYFVLCFLGSHLLRSESTVVNFAGFNLIAIPIGLLLTIALTAYLDRPEIVSHALMLTMGITLLMMALAMIVPQFFQGLGRTLAISLVCVILVEAIGGIFFRGIFNITDYIVAALMCLFIGYDWSKLQDCPRTAQCAIGLAASLYLDIINLFIRLLSILGKKDD